MTLYYMQKGGLLSENAILFIKNQVHLLDDKNKIK